MKHKIDWSNTREGKSFKIIGTNNHFYFEMIEFYERDYSVGYLINLRHGDGLHGHYVAAIRDGLLLFEGEGMPLAPDAFISEDRPRIVHLVLQKNQALIPLAFQKPIQDAYGIKW